MTLLVYAFVYAFVYVGTPVSSLACTQAYL